MRQQLQDSQDVLVFRAPGRCTAPSVIWPAQTARAPAARPAWAQTAGTAPVRFSASGRAYFHSVLKIFAARSCARVGALASGCSTARAAGLGGARDTTRSTALAACG